jgi:hypothetical protein
MHKDRTEPRVKLDVRLVLRWVDQGGNPRSSHGKVEDISDRGVGVRAYEPIKVGTKLEVRTPMGSYSGTVVWSRPEGEECLLGIKRDLPEKPQGEKS